MLLRLVHMHGGQLGGESVELLLYGRHSGRHGAVRVSKRVKCCRVGCESITEVGHRVVEGGVVIIFF